MKALLCKAFGPAETLALEEIASPTPAKNEVLIEVHAAGVNFPDTLIIEGKYQFKPPFPFAPGGATDLMARTASEVSIEFDPGSWKMPRDALGCPFSLLSML